MTNTGSHDDKFTADLDDVLEMVGHLVSLPRIQVLQVLVQTRGHLQDKPLKMVKVNHFGLLLLSML